jgi:ketosteroid isomerase-like protein
MTETANEALIRNAYAAFALGEIDKLLDLVDPNLEWTYLDPGLPDPAPQTCHGRGELAAALRRQAESGLSSRLEEVRASGDQVLVVSHTPGIDAYRVTPADDRKLRRLQRAAGPRRGHPGLSGRADAIAAMGIA